MPQSLGRIYVHAVFATKNREPLIIAPVGLTSSMKYRLYVPDNIGDRVAGTWSHGGTASIADYRAEKDVWPTQLPDGSAVLEWIRTRVIHKAGAVHHCGGGGVAEENQQADGF